MFKYGKDRGSIPAGIIIPNDRQISVTLDKAHTSLSFMIKCAVSVTTECLDVCGTVCGAVCNHAAPHNMPTQHFTKVQ